MFYCIRLPGFQKQIQQEEKYIRNSDGKDSVNVRSDACNQSQLSVWHQSAPVPIPRKSFFTKTFTGWLKL